MDLLNCNRYDRYLAELTQNHLDTSLEPLKTGPDRKKSYKLTVGFCPVNLRFKKKLKRYTVHKLNRLET